jgi:aminoglycoside phosphotransferase (APT) family kinase protein
LYFTLSPLEMLTPEYSRTFLPTNATAVHPVNVYPLVEQGLSSAMYSFQLAYVSDGAKKNREYILRVYKEGFEDKGPKEFELLNALKKHNILVPMAYCFNANNGSDEKPFMIMEKIKGKTAAELLREETNASFIVEKLAEVLAKIHKLDPGIIRNANVLQSQYEFKQQQMSKVRFFIEKSKGFPGFSSPLQRKFMTSLSQAEELKRHEYQPAILHGEYIPGHVLVSNGQFTAVDWGEALVGDPAFDVAWMYHELNLGFKKNETDLGELFVESYEKFSGRKLSNLEFCKDMVALKLAVWYGLSPFSAPSLFSFYRKMVDLTFGNILGKLSNAAYMRDLKNRMRSHHTNGQRSADQYQKYVARYFESSKQRKV